MIFQALLTAALAATTFRGVAARSLRRQDDLASRIETEVDIALPGVLNNIGPNGDKAPGAFAGVVIASPSTVDPDCKVDQSTHKQR